MAEASRLHTIYRVLDMVVDHGGGFVPIELEGETKATVRIESATLLSRVNRVLERTSARLEWLRSRHVVRAPSHFAERLEIQRYRIAQAMRLIAPHWRDVCEIQLEQDAVPTGKPRKADLPGAANKDLSADLSGAIGRTIAASYGVIKIARQRFG